MPYFVYILRTSKNTLYTGITTDLARRLAEHESKSGKAAKYTRSFTSVRLAYSERVATREDALRREWQIKKLGKSQKELLVLRGTGTAGKTQRTMRHPRRRVKKGIEYKNSTK